MKDKIKKIFAYTYKENAVLITQQKATLLCFFLGVFGIHRYFMGYKYWWLMFLTMGGIGIWSLLDLWKIYTGTLAMADGTSLKQ
jgi:hypothetical protein